MIKKTEEYLQDAEGLKSSKRLIGVILIGVTLLMSFLLFVYCLFHDDVKLALDIIRTLAYAGASLLGLGIFDRIFNKK